MSEKTPKPHSGTHRASPRNPAPAVHPNVRLAVLMESQSQHRQDTPFQVHENKHHKTPESGQNIIAMVWK